MMVKIRCSPALMHVLHVRRFEPGRKDASGFGFWQVKHLRVGARP